MKDAEFSAVLARRDERELLATRARLIDDKKKIERQISDDKHDMQAERAELLNSGVEPREAQIRATAGGDADWRSRAVHAGIVIDAQLSRVKLAIAELRVTKQERNKEAQVAAGGGRQRHEQWELFLALVKGSMEGDNMLDVDDDWCVKYAHRAVRMQSVFDRVRSEQ